MEETRFSIPFCTLLKKGLEIMYYQINESIIPIKRKNIDPDKLTIGLISLEDLDKCYTSFGFSPSTVAECKSCCRHMHSKIDSYKDYIYGIIFGINEHQIMKVQDRIGIYIKHNLLLIVIIEDKDNSVLTKFNKMLDQLNITKMSQEKLIFSFLERLIIEDYDMLEDIETEISEHEDRINTRKLDKSFNCEITEIRKKLLLIDDYYQQLIAIGEELEENSSDLFSEENLRYFKIFSDKAYRLSSNTRMLQEYSVQIREAYHSQLDNDLNNTMELFTVITTIFLPLTLIVGWYGMNFTTMPELTWKYGYLFVITLSIVVVIICLIYFKKKKFM